MKEMFFVYHPHKNDFNIDKNLFWMIYFIMNKTTLVKYGLISSEYIIVLKKNVNMKLQYNIILNSTSI